MSRKFLGVAVGLLLAALIPFGINFGLAAAGAEPVSSAPVLGMVIGCSVAFAIMNTGGRRKVTMADRTARDDAVMAAPTPGTARILVFREGFLGKRNGVDVSLDGRDVTQLLSPQFTSISVPPGQHVLRAALAGSLNATSKPGETTLTLAEGQIAVFRVKLAMRMATSDVVLTREEDAARGRLGRMKMVLAAA